MIKTENINDMNITDSNINEQLLRIQRLILTIITYLDY